MTNIEGEGGNFANKNLQNVVFHDVHRGCQSVLYFQNLNAISQYTPNCNVTYTKRGGGAFAAPITMKNTCADLFYRIRCKSGKCGK